MTYKEVRELKKLLEEYLKEVDAIEYPNTANSIKKTLDYVYMDLDWREHEDGIFIKGDRI